MAFAMFGVAAEPWCLGSRTPRGTEGRAGWTPFSGHPSVTPRRDKIAPGVATQNSRLANYSSAAARCRYFFEGSPRRAEQILLDPGRFLKRLSADLILTSP
jgi:hypothetical protein